MLVGSSLSNDSQGYKPLKDFHFRRGNSGSLANCHKSLTLPSDEVHSYASIDEVYRNVLFPLEILL